MSTILLLDTNCGPCSSAGRTITDEGLLENLPVSLGSLHNEHLRAKVQAVRPDARWEPTLLHEDGDEVKVSTGLRLAVELAAFIGVRRAFRISQIVREATEDEAPDSSRRSFLVKLAAVTAAVPLASAGALATSMPRVSARSQLTSEEVERHYRTTLRAERFKRVRRAARVDGLGHRRDHSEPRPHRDGTGSFVADRYGAALVSEEVVALTITYTDDKKNSDRHQYRWITVAVHRAKNRVLSVVDIDISDMDSEVIAPRAATGASRVGPELPDQVPSGVIRFKSDIGPDLTLNEGAWESTGGVGRAPTPGNPCSLACNIIEALVCTFNCGLLGWFVPIAGLVCAVVCVISFTVVCHYSNC